MQGLCKKHSARYCATIRGARVSADTYSARPSSNPNDDRAVRATDPRSPCPGRGFVVYGRGRPRAPNCKSEVAFRCVLGNPELRCYGILVVFEDVEAFCDLGDDCEALPYREDFALYRAAHPNAVSADVLMDPEP